MVGSSEKLSDLANMDITDTRPPMASLRSKEVAQPRLIQLPELGINDGGHAMDERTSPFQCKVVIAEVRRIVRQLAHQDSYILHGENTIGLQRPFAYAWERRLCELLKPKSDETGNKLEMALQGLVD